MAVFEGVVSEPPYPKEWVTMFFLQNRCVCVRYTVYLHCICRYIFSSAVNAVTLQDNYLLVIVDSVIIIHLWSQSDWKGTAEHLQNIDCWLLEQHGLCTTGTILLTCTGSCNYPMPILLQIWDRFFALCTLFIAQPCLQLERFSELRKLQYEQQYI